MHVNFSIFHPFLLKLPVTILSPGKRDPPVGGHDIMVFVLAQASHQTKVTDLHQLLGCQQHVSRRQVPVNVSAALQVLHPSRNLSGEEPEAHQRVLILSETEDVIQGATNGQLCHLSVDREKSSENVSRIRDGLKKKKKSHFPSHHLQGLSEHHAVEAYDVGVV